MSELGDKLNKIRADALANGMKTLTLEEILDDKDSEIASLRARVKELEGIRFDLEQDALLFPTMAEYENVKDDNERLTRQLAEAQGRIEKLEGENAVLKSLLPPNEYATYFG